MKKRYILCFTAIGLLSIYLILAIIANWAYPAGLMRETGEIIEHSGGGAGFVWIEEPNPDNPGWVNFIRTNDALILAPIIGIPVLIN